MSYFWSTWGLRLLALALALLAWFVVNVGKRELESEQIVEPFVTYNTPNDFIILNPQEKVRVRLRGPSSRISTLNPFQVSVVVELRSAQKGTHEVHLNPGNVVAPPDLDVVSIEPSLFTLELDRVVTQLKPVDAQISGEPAAGAIAQEPTVEPLQVLVRGPESRVSQLPALITSPVSLDGHAFDFEEQAAVISPDSLVRVVQPAVVLVKVRMDLPNSPLGDEQ